MNAGQPAFRDDERETTTLLPKKHAGVNAHNRKYGSTIAAAAFSDDRHIVQALVKAKRNVNVGGGGYGSPFQTACENEIVETDSRHQKRTILGLTDDTLTFQTRSENIPDFLFYANAYVNGTEIL